MCRVMEEMRGDEQIECALADGVLCEKAARYSKMPFGKTFYILYDAFDNINVLWQHKI